MKLKIMKVIGNSMHPALESGAFVLLCQYAYLTQLPAGSNESVRLAHRLSFRRLLSAKLSLQVGDIVAVAHPTYGQIIKRVTQLEYQLPLDENGISLGKRQLTRLRLKGDNKVASTSEEAMGWVEAQHFIGKVIYQVSR